MAWNLMKFHQQQELEKKKFIHDFVEHRGIIGSVIKNIGTIILDYKQDDQWIIKTHKGTYLLKSEIESTYYSISDETESQINNYDIIPIKTINNIGIIDNKQYIIHWIIKE